MRSVHSLSPPARDFHDRSAEPHPSSAKRPYRVTTTAWTSSPLFVANGPQDAFRPISVRRQFSYQRRLDRLSSDGSNRTDQLTLRQTHPPEPATALRLRRRPLLRRLVFVVELLHGRALLPDARRRVVRDGADARARNRQLPERAIDHQRSPTSSAWTVPTTVEPSSRRTRTGREFGSGRRLADRVERHAAVGRMRRRAAVATFSFLLRSPSPSRSRSPSRRRSRRRRLLLVRVAQPPTPGPNKQPRHRRRRSTAPAPRPSPHSAAPSCARAPASPRDGAPPTTARRRSAGTSPCLRGTARRSARTSGRGRSRETRRR